MGLKPFHALRLKSGKVLVTYGYRRKPFGIRARLCNGELSDLNEAPEMILRDDAPNGDLVTPIRFNCQMVRSWYPIIFQEMMESEKLMQPCLRNEAFYTLQLW